jgi:mitochondrial fission protein ELM1
VSLATSSNKTPAKELHGDPNDSAKKLVEIVSTQKPLAYILQMSNTNSNDFKNKTRKLPTKNIAEILKTHKTSQFLVT